MKHLMGAGLALILMLGNAWAGPLDNTRAFIALNLGGGLHIGESHGGEHSGGGHRNHDHGGLGIGGGVHIGVGVGVHVGTANHKSTIHTPPNEPAIRDFIANGLSDNEKVQLGLSCERVLQTPELWSEEVLLICRLVAANAPHP